MNSKNIRMQHAGRNAGVRFQNERHIDAYRHGYKETNIERSDCKIDIYKSGILYFCIYV